MKSYPKKDKVLEFWSANACGEELLLNDVSTDGFSMQAEQRYILEPYILSFGAFKAYAKKRVLEIGLGLGADHEKFSESGAILHGIDLTERSVSLTKLRLDLRGLTSDVRVGDAENLPYESNFFDLVYSWGVIHHTPDTARAAQEIIRVLKPGGEFKVMIYHKWSLVGIMLWFRYAFFLGKFWVGLNEIYDKYLESPGTKAYTKRDAEGLFKGAEDLQIKIELSHGDLLSSGAGQRHSGPLLDFARKIWPRSFLSEHANRWGLFLLISGRKKV